MWTLDPDGGDGGQWGPQSLSSSRSRRRLPSSIAHDHRPGAVRKQDEPDLATLTSAAPCTPPDPARLAIRDELRSFGAVAALQCFSTEHTYPDGEWNVKVRKASQTGIDAFVQSLDAPDASMTTGACADILIFTPPVALIDSEGAYLFPRFPLDGCRQPQAELVDHITDWQVISTTKVRLDKSRAEIDAGCEHEWKNEILLDSQGGTKSGDGGRVFASTPVDETLHACIYRTETSDPSVGVFDRGVMVTAPDAQRLRDALAGAGPSGDCAPQDEFAVVMTVSKAWLNLELGGCWRVERNDTGHFSLGSADGTTVQAILGGS